MASSTPEHDSGNYSSSDECIGHSKQLTLLRALQDLERANKAEQWYKQELETQKTTRLETLERLYTQERKHLSENRRLQQECLQLYSKCAALERELERRKQAEELVSSVPFVNDQQSAVIAEQEQLIALLRCQKKELLAELETLSAEYDEKLLGLQLENSLVTDKCKRLLREQHDLVESLAAKEQRLRVEGTERVKLQRIITELNEAQQVQEQLLALKENQLVTMRQQLTTKLEHQAQLAAQAQENAALRAELDAYEDCKAAQLDKLSSEKVALQQRVQAVEQRFQRAEQELIEQHQQYADLCDKHEQTKFELNALKFNAASHSEELKCLRECLEQALLKKNELSACIATNEGTLQSQLSEMRSLRKTLLVKSDELEALQASSLAEQELNEQLAELTNERGKLVRLLERTLEQQRVHAATAADWQQLHSALNASKALSDELSTELQHKRDELAELNALFNEQHDELEQLQQLVHLLDCKRDEELRAECKQNASLKLQNAELQQLLAQAKLRPSLNANYKVTNLIDDYKQLILESAYNSKRPSTNDIHALIERSNSCQPNLMKLEASLKGVSTDIQKLVAQLKITKRNEYIPPSLMAELCSVAATY